MSELVRHPSYALLLDLLRQQIGLDPTSACASKLPCVLPSLGVQDARQLASFVLAAQRQPSHLQELIKQIVVHETWFYREPAAFRVLAQAGLDVTAQGRRFRVLSAPCSTGEEPYSVALALIEAGVPRDLIDIVALDISGEAVEQARQGHFAEMAFRGTTPEWRDARFVREGLRWRLKEPLNDVVRFETANLMDLPEHIAQDCFDVVLCRNLLIYLDAAARQRVFKLLRTLAKPETGLIFVGHAESTDAFQGELARVQVPMSFGFHNRAASNAVQSATLLGQASTMRNPIHSAIRRVTQPTASDATAGKVTLTSLTAPFQDPLRDVRMLADRGEIERAMSLCEQVIAMNPQLADAHGYRGVLAVASHQTHLAKSCFIKALYLNPSHADSLHHLMLLAQDEGDTDAAQRYRDRLRRLQAQESSGGREALEADRRCQGTQACNADAITQTRGVRS